MLATSSGLCAQFLIFVGFSLSANNPPVIELRVVSLPPTISRVRLPMNSRNGISRVAAPCANIDNRSNFGGSLARSLKSSAIPSAILFNSSNFSCSECTGDFGARTLQIATSDQ